eukprot:jgi/Mesen1/11037/ME000098S10430
MRNRRIAIIFVVTAALVTISIVQLKIQQLLKILFVGGLANMISYYFYGSLLQRRIKIFVVAITVFVDYRIARKYDKWLLTSQRKKDAMWERAHERNAKRVYRAIVSLEGLWVKAGQYLSTRADVLPEPYIRRLKLLQDTLPPRPLSEVFAAYVAAARASCQHPRCMQVYATVESELGRKIAQVHRATLQDGTDVVVKVQHTGVKQRILQQDLANLGTIVEWVAWAEPEYNFRPVLDEWASEVPKELNFVTEAENTRAVAANLDYSSSSSTKKADAFTRVDVLLPSVLQRVLVMTYMDGVRLGDIAGLDGLGVDKHELVESITRAYAHQIYVDAFFNADPHPEMGLRLRMDMPDDAMAVTSFFFRRAAPPKESIELEEQAKEESGEKSLRRNPVDAFPGELVFFMRVLNLLRGVSSMLGARVAYLDVMRPFAEAILSRHVAHVLADSRHLSSEGWVRDSPLLGPLDAKVRALLVDLGRRGKMLGMQWGHVHVEFTKVRTHASGYTFTRACVRAQQVAHVLTHTAGLENALAAELLPQPMKMCNWADMLARLAAATPASAPGEKEAYHYLTFGWLTGGIVEGATGQPFQQVLQEAFIRPLGVDGEFYIGIPSGVESRLATLALDRKEPAALPQGQEQGQAQQLQQGAAARAQQQQHHHTPSTIQDDSASTLPLIFNALFIRRAVIPAANGHFSARALARFYAALGAGGAIPSLPSSSDPPLGSTGRQKQEEDERRKREDEEHAEKQRQKKDRWKVWKRIGPGGSSRTGPSPGGSPATADPQGRTTKPRRDVASPSSAPGSDASRALLDGYVATPGARDPAATAGGGSLFPGSPNPAPGSPHIIDEFVGEGEFQHLCMPGDKFGLGFLKFPSSEQPPRKGESSLSPSPSPSSLTLTPLPSPPSASRRWPAFGHTGMGGSVGFTDPEHGFAIAVTLNQLSAENEAAAAVVRLVCTELGVPVPARYE